MKKYSKLIPVFLASAALVACATNDDSTTKFTEFSLEDPRIGEEVKRVCRGNGINGFGETTRNTVVVSTGVNKRHLLKVSGGCFNLKHAQSIAFDQHSSCIARGDKLVAFESVFGPSTSDRAPMKCFITNIYEYDIDALTSAELESSEKEQAQ